MRRVETALWAFGLLALGCVAGGCGGGRGGKTVVTQFPRWDFQRYQRLAVLPVQANDRRARRDAENTTATLTDLLTNNGAFTVLNRQDVAAAMTEQDFARLADVADPATALPEGRMQIAQALVSAKITTYDIVADRKEARVPRYVTNPHGVVLRDRYGRPIIAGYDVIEEYRHAASLGGTVRVIDAATGQTLASHTSAPIVVERVQRGAPPPESPEELAAAAASELATEFYKHIAPINTRVNLKGDMLTIALDYYEGRYETTKKVPVSLDQFLVVVRNLPGECDRNSFRLTVAPEKERRDLAKFDFIWSANSGPAGMSFPVPVAALTGASASKFVSKLFSGDNPAPILTRKFETEAPKEEKHSRKSAKSSKKSEARQPAEAPADIDGIE